MPGIERTEETLKGLRVASVAGLRFWQIYRDGFQLADVAATIKVVTDMSAEDRAAVVGTCRNLVALDELKAELADLDGDEAKRLLQDMVDGIRQGLEQAKA